LLLDADLMLMDRYLKHPPREPAYRQGRSHLDFVMNMRQIDCHVSSLKLEEWRYFL